MTTPAFTPGPWEWGINPRGSFSNELVVRPAGEFPHGQWIADCGPRSDDERKANACLISASPKLYEALKRILPHPIYGTTDEAKERKYWESEKAQGRAEAEDVLFALDALADARLVIRILEESTQKEGRAK